MTDPAGDAARPADGRSTRWAAHRARRREQLIDAALTVLGTHGAEFGLDQVAAEAGVTKPVIYRHFGDRAALLDAMAERATNRLMERLMPAVYDQGAPRARIRASITAMTDFLEDSPNVFLLYGRRLPDQSSDVVGVSKEFISSALGPLLQEHILAVGFDRPDVVAVWAEGLIGFVQNATEWWLTHRELDRELMIDNVTMLIWAQIYGLYRMHGVSVDPDFSLPLEP